MCLSLGKRMHLRARKNRSRQTKRCYHSSSRGSHPRTSRKTPGVKEKQRRTGCAGSERGSAAEGEEEAEARQGQRVAGAVGGPGLWVREKARAGGDQGDAGRVGPAGRGNRPHDKPGGKRRGDSTSSGSPPLAAAGQSSQPAVAPTSPRTGSAESGASGNPGRTIVLRHRKWEAALRKP